MAEWTKQEHQYLADLANHSTRKQWTKWAEDMSHHFKREYNADSLRTYWRMNIRYATTPVTPEYKEEVEILSNGNVKSDKLVQLSLEQAKDPQYILEAHGFDHTAFELVSAKSSQWNHSNKEHGTSVSYASKITVRPKRDEVTEQDIINTFTTTIQPVEVRVNYIGENNLVIALADLHFGITKLSHTVDKLSEIKEIISNGYKTIVIEQLGDLFHSSQMKSSQTLKGTILEDVDMVQAIEDAKSFFDVIIQSALKYSKEVRIEHAGGNHSDNLEYMFLLYLETKYPDLIVNRHNDTRSAYLLDNVGIMITHGDTAKNKLPGLFAHEFKLIWAQSETMEIHTGHFHGVEKEFDGVVLRQMGTVKPNDGYEIVNGWVMNRKVIQLIEYDENRAKVIYEV